VARPSKYDWDGIKEAYEGGLDKADICRKYKLPLKNLNDKIRVDDWSINGVLKSDVDGFYAKAENIAENISKLHPLNQELMIESVDTRLQDNELIGNNRKIAKMLQGVIVANRQDINLRNIRNVSGVMKDIESIANPQANRQDITVNNQTNVALQTITRRIID
jgi:hypothetical protein